jgi:alpha-L-fucosidase
VSILPGWFYHNDDNMKTAEQLMDLYERSVGRNASLILNIPPDKRGLFTDAAVQTLKEFGILRQTRYGVNLIAGAIATASSSLPNCPASAAVDGDYETYWEAQPKGDSDAPVILELALPRRLTFTRIVLQEQIRRSQRVEAFAIEVQEPDGRWRQIAEATTIGYKRIVAVPETSAMNVRIRFDAYRVAPTIAELGIYY